jgi:hypothetical protein
VQERKKRDRKRGRIPRDKKMGDLSWYSLMLTHRGSFGITNIADDDKGF